MAAPTTGCNQMSRRTVSWEGEKTGEGGKGGRNVVSASGPCQCAPVNDIIVVERYLIESKTRKTDEPILLVVLFKRIEAIKTIGNKQFPIFLYGQRSREVRERSAEMKIANNSK